MIDESKLSELEREKLAHFATRHNLLSTQQQLINVEAERTRREYDAFVAALSQKGE